LTGFSLLASASCLKISPHRLRRHQVDAAFRTWQQQQQLSEELMHRAVNRLAHPDVPLRLVFQGNAKPCTLPGSATIDDLRGEAIRLHNLDGQKQFRFVLGGVKLRAGVAISETPLANTEDLDVVVLPQAAAVTGGAWRYEAVAAHGRSGLNKAAARALRPNPKRPVGAVERAAITRRIRLRPVSAAAQFPTFATHPNGQ